MVKAVQEHLSWGTCFFVLKGNEERWWVSEASVLQGNRRHFIPTPPPREMCRRQTSLRKKSQMLLHHSHTPIQALFFCIYVHTKKKSGFRFCLKNQHKTTQTHQHAKSTCKPHMQRFIRPVYALWNNIFTMPPQSPGQMLSRFPEECFLREKGKASETGFESQGRFFFMMSFPARSEVQRWQDRKGLRRDAQLLSRCWETASREPENGKYFMLIGDINKGLLSFSLFNLQNLGMAIHYGSPP